MDFAAIAAALAEAGGWAAFLATTIALGVAFVKGWLVPRFVLDREIERADKATETLGKSIAELASEVRWRGRGTEPPRDA